MTTKKMPFQCRMRIPRPFANDELRHGRVIVTRQRLPICATLIALRIFHEFSGSNMRGHQQWVLEYETYPGCTASVTRKAAHTRSHYSEGFVTKVHPMDPLLTLSHSQNDNELPNFDTNRYGAPELLASFKRRTAFKKLRMKWSQAGIVLPACGIFQRPNLNPPSPSISVFSPSHDLIPRTSPGIHYSSHAPDRLHPSVPRHLHQS